MRLISRRGILVLLSSLFILSAWADDDVPAPVVDLSVVEKAGVDALTVPQRVTRLEQQMINLSQMDLSSRVEVLQQQVQSLRGQLETQAYALEKLRAREKENSGVVSKQAGASAEAIVPEIQADPGALAYQKALNLLTNKQYEEAIKQFQAYLKAYPDSERRGRAYYWLGQIYYMQSKFKQASWQFKALLDQYPKEVKASEALLKLGLIHVNQGQTVLAQKEFNQVMQQYPDSQAAKIAKEKLKCSLGEAQRSCA